MGKWKDKILGRSAGEGPAVVIRSQFQGLPVFEGGLSEANSPEELNRNLRLVEAVLAAEGRDIRDIPDDVQPYVKLLREVIEERKVHEEARRKAGQAGLGLTSPPTRSIASKTRPRLDGGLAQTLFPQSRERLDAAVVIVGQRVLVRLELRCPARHRHLYERQFQPV